MLTRKKYELLMFNHERLKESGTTALLCTGRPEDIRLDGWLYLGAERQERCGSLAELQSRLSPEEVAHALPA